LAKGGFGFGEFSGGEEAVALVVEDGGGEFWVGEGFGEIEAFLVGE
jgi:hypothetical protein